MLTSLADCSEAFTSAGPDHGRTVQSPLLRIIISSYAVYHPNHCNAVRGTLFATNRSLADAYVGFVDISDAPDAIRHGTTHARIVKDNEELKDDDASSEDWKVNTEKKAEGGEKAKPLGIPATLVYGGNLPEDEDVPDVFDVNGVDWDLNFTPLCHAVLFSSPPIVELLLNAGADATFVSLTNNQLAVLPLALTILTEDEDRACKIAQMSETLVANKLQLVSTFLRCDPNARTALNFPTLIQTRAISPLITAVQNQNYSMLAVLLAHGAKLDIAGEDLARAAAASYGTDITPLVAAIAGRHWDTARLIMTIAGLQYKPVEKPMRFSTVGIRLDASDHDYDSSDVIIDQGVVKFVDIAKIGATAQCDVSPNLLLSAPLSWYEEGSPLTRAVYDDDFEAFVNIPNLYKPRSDLDSDPTLLAAIPAKDRPEMLDDVHGAKRLDLAKAERPGPFAPAVAHADPLLWQAAGAGACEVVEYLAGERPLVAYRFYAASNSDGRARGLRRVPELEEALPELLGWGITPLGESPLFAAVGGKSLPLLKKLFSKAPQLMGWRCMKVKGLGVNAVMFAVYLNCLIDLVDFLRSAFDLPRRYRRDDESRLTLPHSMSAALDGGTEVMTFVYSFAVGGAGGKTTNFPNWALNPDYCKRLT
ncbi:hypothetical protein DFH09DRAFT_1354489 [Mycena vulgaris]|nr:hypothetical protein DFH09DRAFT_1354489 [Mycena vulgaris]